MKTVFIYIYVYRVCSYHIVSVCVCVCEETHLILFLRFLNDFQRFLPSPTLWDSLWGLHTHVYYCLYIYRYIILFLSWFSVSICFNGFFFSSRYPARPHRSTTDRPVVVVAATVSVVSHSAPTGMLHIIILYLGKYNMFVYNNDTSTVLDICIFIPIAFSASRISVSDPTAMCIRLSCLSTWQ